MNNILVTGGAGYCGSVLVPDLLKKDYKVRVLDMLFFGNPFTNINSEKLEIVRGDIRDIEILKKVLQGIDIVIHLACISNDASFELNENLSKTINFDAFEPLVQLSKNNGVSRFLYVSSSSVYGVSDKMNVKEDHPLVPLTLYNKFKGLCEPILFKYDDKNFCTSILRPATVCGYGPRQRLDVSVNILTNLAVNTGLIKVFGGSQLRPNLHIQDYSDVCQLIIRVPKEKIRKQIFNCGYENLSILEIAQNVKSVISKKNNLKINIEPSDDLRSYHINSDKIHQVLNFKPKRNVIFAIEELKGAFEKGLLPNSLSDDIYYNVKLMKKLRIK